VLPTDGWVVQNNIAHFLMLAHQVHGLLIDIFSLALDAVLQHLKIVSVCGFR
jgi:hypothetical protein